MNSDKHKDISILILHLFTQKMQLKETLSLFTGLPHITVISHAARILGFFFRKNYLNVI